MPDPTTGCTLASTLNSDALGLGLPIAKGDTTTRHARYISGALTIFPPGVKVTTTTSTTTTVPVATNTPSVAQGGQLTVTGDGWKPGSTVNLTLLSTPVALGSATVDANGAFSKTVTIPPDTPTGAHQIQVSGTDPSGAARTVTSAITVTSAQVTTASLPRTGSSTVPMTVLALSLIVGGLALVLSGRRRFARS